MHSPLVSVVTPFYNTADWLAACIESVLAQDYENFEYLLVNNCSTDGGAEIARDYALRDPRIRVVDQPTFLSQSQNFNAALRLISPDSKYCKMVLADDLLRPHCLSEMVAVAERHPTVGIVSSYFHSGKSLHAVGLPYPQEFFDGRELGRKQLLEGLYFLGSPSVVMYRADLVRRNPEFFVDHKFSADSTRAYKTLLEADVGFVHQALSFLREHDDSIGASVSRYRHYLLDVYIQLQTHGKRLLTPDEHQRVLHRVQREYFGFLGVATIYNDRPGLWEFTQGGLATIGESFTGWRRVRWTVTGVVLELGRPMNLLRFVARKLFRSRPTSLLRA